MGCNAWNHRADCNCGWGGDTGGGGWSGNSAVRIPRMVDGYDWHFGRKPTYDTYVNPNATCPVCGASVFYYQSPFGGRVFFDELGPPWPKHPCTDNYRAGVPRRQASTLIFAAAQKAPVKAPPYLAKGAWRPLLYDELNSMKDHVRLRMPQGERLPGRYIYMPSGWAGHAPAYWRWCPDDPGKIEISCFRLGPTDDLEERVFTLPNWIKDDDSFHAWTSDPSLEDAPETLNAIGYALSFAWRMPVDNWYDLWPHVDLKLAMEYFERSAVSGYWAAINNLGVMYRDGIGVDRDPRRAFELFERAAQSLEMVPLQHLANCHRDGLGCERNPELAIFLDELIAVRREETKSAAA